MEADNVTSIPVSHDAEWLARHPRLDGALTAAIRAPVVDQHFNQQAWALIRADEAEAKATQQMLRMRLGTPWWLASLNVVAIAATAVAVVLALGSVATRPLAESALAELAFVGQPSNSARIVTLLAGAAALWFGLRLVPFARAFGSAWL